MEARISALATVLTGLNQKVIATDSRRMVSVVRLRGVAKLKMAMYLQKIFKVGLLMDEFISTKRQHMKFSAVVLFHCLDKRINFESGYYKLKGRLL